MIYDLLHLNTVFACSTCQSIVSGESCPDCTSVTRDYTGSFSKVVLSHRAVNQVFFGVFLMFLAFFHSKIWAKIHFGTFEPYKQEKHLKISSTKKVRFQGWLKMAQFLLTEF